MLPAEQDTQGQRGCPGDQQKQEGTCLPPSSTSALPSSRSDRKAASFAHFSATLAASASNTTVPQPLVSRAVVSTSCGHKSVESAGDHGQQRHRRDHNQQP